jgi:hypothetical protein
VRTLITTRDLMSATCLWKNSNVYMFDVRSGNGERNDIFRFACGCTCMAADATGVIDYLGPLNWA